MRSIRFTILIVAAALLGGCASITEGKTEPVSVQTIQGNKEVSGAGCTLTNDSGKWFVTSPGSTVVHKSTGDMVVDCQKDHVGHGSATVSSSANGGVWGNIVAGGLIGYAIDASSGAGYDYPSTITVTLARPNDEGAGLSSPSLIPAAYVPDPEPALPALDPGMIAGKPHPADLAIIIGIDHYARLPRADYAEDDARDFVRYATGVMGIEPTKVKVLTGSAASRNEIIKAVTSWAKAEMTPGQSTVTVFFSGHGLASPDGKDSYLMPADGDVTVLKDSGIRREEIIDRLNQAGAKNIVMMLDTCYSGISRTGQTLMADARPVVLSSVPGSFGPNVTVLAAAANDQISSALPAAHHGALSYFLMKGLEGGADANGDHRITAAEMEAFVRDRVAKEVVRQGREQTPQLIGDGARVLAEW